MVLSLLRSKVVLSRTVISRSVAVSVPHRNLNIHEFQSQKLLKAWGVNCPNGNVAETPAEAEKIAELLSTTSPDFVVKAQVLAGGRGKGTFTNGFKGGVHVCSSPKEVRTLAEKMLQHNLVTKQTGAKGKPVNQVYICERKYLRKEMYLAMLMDRSKGGPAIVVSPQGGMDIETVARESPEAIYVEPIDITAGPQRAQLLRAAEKMGVSPNMLEEAATQMGKLYDFFIKHDCTLLEINPLAETSNGQVMAMDAKLNFDDNAAYRQPEIFALRDKSQEDPREVRATEVDLNYIGLDGSIGCLVNGAGLAMATMDLIKLHGGAPANFLDVGGGASQKQVTEAIKIISSDPNVKSILINIFGGIMKCDIIALGLVAAVKELGIKIPLVVRLQGTNVEQAKKIMEESYLKLISSDDLDDAAKKAVRVAEIVSLAEKAELGVSFQLPI